MLGAPVSPREPPATSTAPELNFVESRRAARDARDRAGLDQPDVRRVLGRRARAGCRSSITRTAPACSLPGAIHRPGLAAWKVAVAAARTATPCDLAGRGVDAAGDVGGDDRRARGRSAPRSRPRRARAARRSKPVPSSASTTHRARRPAPRARTATGAVAGQALEVGRASPLQLAAVGRAASTSTSRPCSRSSRAATSPSPPLLPFPHTTATGPSGATPRRDAGKALARPLHQLERGHALLLDRPRVDGAHARGVGKRLEPGGKGHGPMLARTRGRATRR